MDSPGVLRPAPRLSLPGASPLDPRRSSEPFYSPSTPRPPPDPSGAATRHMGRRPLLVDGRPGGAGNRASSVENTSARALPEANRAREREFASTFFSANGVNDSGLALHLVTKRVLGEEPPKIHIPHSNFSFTRPTHLFVPHAGTAAVRSSAGRRREDSAKSDGHTSDRRPTIPSASGPDRWEVPDTSETSSGMTKSNDESNETKSHSFSVPREGGSRPFFRKTEEAAEGTTREETQHSGATTPRLRRGKVPVPSMTENEVLLFTRDTGTLPRTRDTKYVASRMRTRNALFCYALLDPYNQGYIDVQEACDSIGSIHKQDKDVAELLLSILQDMLTFVSSR